MFERRNCNKYIKIALSLGLTTAGLALILFFIAPRYMPSRSATPQLQKQENVPLPQQISTEITGTPNITTINTTPVVAAVAKSATPGVVGISVLRADSGAIFEQNSAEKWGIGSGFIVTSNGYIVTNHHVAGGKSKRIIVSLADGRNIDGITTWSDPVLDLAVVKIDLTGLATIPMGDSNAIIVGEPAIAIGNPLGLQFQRTVTSGIISALNRTIKIDTDQGANYMEDLIQTDASINPGNSGGPLLNSKGEVVGINTIKVSSAESMGFAIPVNVVKPIIGQFTQKGDFKEAYMGVFAYDKEVMPYVDANLKLDKGIYVAHVDAKGPAFNSGIREGCVIAQVDGNDINTMMQLRTYIYSKTPGDTIQVTHLKKGTNTFETIGITLAVKDGDGLITR